MSLSSQSQLTLDDDSPISRRPLADNADHCLRLLGLRQNPFSMAPDIVNFYSPPRVEAIIVEVLQHVETRMGFALLYGDVGLGKTTLSRRILLELDRRGIQTALIFNTFFQGAELLREINRDFGVSVEEEGTPGQMAALNAFLLEQRAQGRNCVIIIDDAQNLTVESLELVRQISNMETGIDKIVQIILIGQSELEEKLDLHSLRQLKSRIALKRAFRPYTAKETATYIRTKVARSGERFLLEVTDSAIRRVHAASGGSPRRINVIMGRCLYAAVVKKSLRITRSVAEMAIRDVEESFNPARPAGAGRRMMAAAAIVLLIAAPFLVFELTREGVPSMSSWRAPLHRIASMWRASGADAIELKKTDGRTRVEPGASRVSASNVAAADERAPQEQASDSRPLRVASAAPDSAGDSPDGAPAAAATSVAPRASGDSPSASGGAVSTKGDERVPTAVVSNDARDEREHSEVTAKAHPAATASSGGDRRSPATRAAPGAPGRAESAPVSWHIRTGSGGRGAEAAEAGRAVGSANTARAADLVTADEQNGASAAGADEAAPSESDGGSTANGPQAQASSATTSKVVDAARGSQGRAEAPGEKRPDASGSAESSTASKPAAVVQTSDVASADAQESVPVSYSDDPAGREENVADPAAGAPQEQGTSKVFDAANIDGPADGTLDDPLPHGHRRISDDAGSRQEPAGGGATELDPAVVGFLRAYDLTSFSRQFQDALRERNLGPVADEILNKTGLRLVALPAAVADIESKYATLRAPADSSGAMRYLLFWKPHEWPPESFSESFQTRDVSELQKSLSQFGAYHYYIDGVAGPRTTSALKAFQRGTGLEVTGVPDVETLFMLEFLSPSQTSGLAQSGPDPRID
ncbi:MAG: AAA family ATPase [Arenicellales bacterium]